MSGVPAVPLVEVTINAAWFANANVTVVADEETALKIESAAFVAVTVQVPALGELNVVPPPVIEQPADPALVT